MMARKPSLPFCSRSHRHADGEADEPDRRVAMELASAGMSVVCLERGKYFDVNTDFQKPNVYDELKFDRHSDIFQNLARDTLTFRNNNSQTALPMR